METKTPELLAPAGDESSFFAALSAGADAVYVGGLRFNARAHAHNFDNDSLKRCIQLAHAYGKRVYVTLNTLLYDKEIDDAVRYATELMNMNVDAIICADVGLMNILQSDKKQFLLDASTQLSLHSSFGIKEVEDLHFRQVVVARELTKNNIQVIFEKTDVPLEIFAHGALCVCHSGQCLFSSLVGGRSGNRGECAQPCRLPYQKGYSLSLKDLSLSRHITDILQIGVKSLKIEGRMKSPEYVYKVTQIFRTLLNEKRNATDSEYKELEAIFSRNGFTDGYFINQDEKMLGVRREEDKTRTKEISDFTVPSLSKIQLKASISIQKNKEVLYTIEDSFGRSARVYGPVPNLAISSPLQENDVKERLTKLGGTPFSLLKENIQVKLDEGLNLAPSQINAIRRNAIDQILQEPEKCIEIPVQSNVKTAFWGPRRSALFNQVSVWNALEDTTIEIGYVPLSDFSKATKRNTGVWLPPIILDSEETIVRKQLSEAKEKGAKYALCSNPGAVYLAREYGLKLVGDFRLNITNSSSANYWFQHGVEDAILSPELTSPQARDIGGMVIVYGRIPLMVTERCYAKPIGGCDKCGKISLIDRKNMAFPIIRIPNHRNYILNSIPTYLGDQKDKIPASCREFFLFFTETREEIEQILEKYNHKQALPYPVRRFPK